MKILKLKFKNLNSLYGAWEIDFTDRRYDRYGIFSIIGPTGSGKTTILDAICLALYGRTPRLKSVGKASNEIMSKQKGECSAELLFSVDGKRYRCFWEQRRAYNKSDSNLQTQTHIIYDDDGNELCRKDIGKEGGFVSKLINMSFDQFTQCILLAQGSFAKFLNAGKDEKAAIFEKITGTSIYRSISVKVFERYKDEKKKLEDIDKDKHGLTVFSPEEETEKKQEFAKLVDDIKKIKDEQKECEGKQGVLEEKYKAEDNYNNAVKAKEAAKKALEDFTPQSEALEKAERAAGIAVFYDGLIAAREKAEQDSRQLSEENNRLPGLRKCRKALENQIEIVKKEKGQLEADNNRLSDILKEAEKFEAARKLQEEQLSNAEYKHYKDCIQLDEAEKALKDLCKELAGLDERLQEHNKRQNELNKYKGVSEKLSGWQVILGRLQDDTSALNDERQKAADNSQLQSLEKERKELTDAGERLRKKAEAKQAEITAAENRRQELLGGSDKEKLELQIEVLKEKVDNFKLRASLKEHRLRLKDGCACPLCGSTAHPYAEGQLPVPTDEEEQLERLKDKLKRINEIEKLINEELKMELQALKTAVNNSCHSIDSKNADIERYNQSLLELNQRIKNSSDTIVNQLQGLKSELEAFAEISVSINIDSIESALEALKAAYDELSEGCNEYNANKREIDDISNKIDNKKHETDVLNNNKIIYSERIGELTREIQEVTNNINALNQKILELTGGVDVDEVRKSNNDQTDIIEDIKNQLEADDGLFKRLEAANKAETTCIANINMLRASFEQLNRDFSAAEDGWKFKLKESGFADENDFEAAKIDENGRKTLRKTRDDLNDRLKQAEGAQAESKRIFEAAAKAAEGLQADEIKKELKDIIAGIDDLDGKRIGLKSALDRNEENKKRVGSLEEEYKAQKAVFEIWNTLNNLIGSTGDKYPKFVQNLTLKVLLEQANEALKKMNDRFIMLPGSGEDLEFKVKDLYQGSFERSVKNLSGGESFIVSLALALGLSRMAGRSARIDSFFLDEGFGTLDEDTLGTVMEALKQLRDEGKTIGIISHVDALKELPVRIEVKPEGATGRSIIDGPGCRRLPKDAADETSAGKRAGKRSKKG